MIDPFMQALIDAPLADPIKLNLPAGKRSATRCKAEYGDDIGCPKVSAKELSERKARAAEKKIADLFDYYATTDLTAKTVAEHMGLYRKVQTGVDDDRKPIIETQLDVGRAETQLSWRRAKAA